MPWIVADLTKRMLIHGGPWWPWWPSRDLKQAGRQRDDGGQSYLVKISYCKESLSFTIHRMKLIQLKEDSFTILRVLLNKFSVAYVSVSKGRRCIEDVKIRGFAL